MMRVDIRDRLSEDEYYDISERHGFFEHDYNSYYCNTWLETDLTPEAIASFNGFGKEMYETESRKKQLRLLQEALDI